ncbi:hypothetical protein GCM10026983_40050 [Gracilibacillus alcaliphilus]
MLIDDFEEDRIDKYGTDHTYVTSYQLEISKHAQAGRCSLKVQYDFGGWIDGNGAIYICFKQAPASYRRPERLGLWVRGDGHSPWLRATLIDGEGMKKVVNLTKAGIDWVGWKYVEAPLPSTWPLPIRLDRIYAVETDKTKRKDAIFQGSFYLDNIRYVYQDERDLVGPSFSQSFPEHSYSVMYANSFLFSTKVEDTQSGVNPATIRVLINQQQVAHDFCAEKGLITYRVTGAAEGQLHIEVTAEDYAGNPAMPALERIIKIDLSPDTEPPVLSALSLRDQLTVYTNQPRISFRLIDEQSGINEQDIIICLNHTRLLVNYDPDSGWCYSYPSQPVTEGEQILTIEAQDCAGNQMEPIQLTFYYQNLSLPRHRVKVAILPDTHTAEAFAFIFEQVLRYEPAFVLHMGDMVDQAASEEFTLFQQVRIRASSLPFLAVAGNHEAFQGNLDLFHWHFGPAAYHLELNHALLIVLNSAHQQSLSRSEAGQFDYLQEVLRTNTKSCLIIATHVPIQDTLGTAHEMDPADAAYLHHMLSSYHQQHPQVDIKVLFGHLHVFRSWRQDGIHYVVTGNGARKGYTSHDNGNMLGFSCLEITEMGLDLQFIPLVTGVQLEKDLQESIAIPRGETYPLTVHGLFQHVSPAYSVELTSYSAIPLTWSSSNPDIAGISSGGVVTAHRQGRVIITVCINKVTDQIVVEVT